MIQEGSWTWERTSEDKPGANRLHAPWYLALNGNPSTFGIPPLAPALVRPSVALARSGPLAVPANPVVCRGRSHHPHPHLRDQAALLHQAGATAQRVRSSTSMRSSSTSWRSGLLDQTWRQISRGKAMKASMSVADLVQVRSGGWELSIERGDDLGTLGEHRGRRRAHRRWSAPRWPPRGGRTWATLVARLRT